MADPRGVGRLRVLILLAVLSGCAVPVPPTGGPADQQPPRVQSYDPEPGAVLVQTRRVRLGFDEYLDERSGVTAVSVTPTSEPAPRVRVSGKELTVSFEEPLRENTTYIITVDTGLRDAHGVALKQPITLAFSTGPEINRGRLSGLVLDADDGSPVASIEVYAYALSDSSASFDAVPERPDYRTQTGSDGTFSFSYLARQGYFVVAVTDRNRNRAIDPDEAFAMPPTASVIADTVAIPARWLAARVDSEAPQIRRVLAESDRRIAVRYSEPVTLKSRAPSDWIIGDSTGAALVPTEAVYQTGDDGRDVMLLTAAAPTQPYWLHTAGTVTDSTGNPSSAETIRFDGNSQADTVTTRFLSFSGDTLASGIRLLFPGTAAGLRFSAPPDSSVLASSVSVVDSTDAPRALSTRTDNGSLILVQPVPSFGPGERYRVRVHPPLADTVRSARYQRVRPSQLGELSGVVVLSDSASAPLVVELIPVSGAPRLSTQPDATGRFVFRELQTGGTYRLRAFEDRNENGRWDPGRLNPFRTAEAVTWAASVPPVRARWETVVADTLRITRWP